MRMAHLILTVFGLNIMLSGVTFAQADSIFLDRRVFYKQGIVGVYDIEGNFNPGRYKWSVLTPSRFHLPALSDYQDPNHLQPFPQASAPSTLTKLSDLIYRNCVDSDRCEFSTPPTDVGEGKRLHIRLSGIHTPRVKAACEQENFLGNEAKELIHGYLTSAVHIELRNFSNRGKEIVGRVFADGQDLSELLVTQGLAEKFRRNKKDWCS